MVVPGKTSVLLQGSTMAFASLDSTAALSVGTRGMKVRSNPAPKCWWLVEPGCWRSTPEKRALIGGPPRCRTVAPKADQASPPHAPPSTNGPQGPGLWVGEEMLSSTESGRASTRQAGVVEGTDVKCLASPTSGATGGSDPCDLELTAGAASETVRCTFGGQTACGKACCSFGSDDSKASGDPGGGAMDGICTGSSVAKATDDAVGGGSPTSSSKLRDGRRARIISGGSSKVDK
mmetsp:Transcript_76303/g.223705  ORF Transcript_76303/g.223705 Transcript_76303/m.223705 type:complete len:234 (-) Transcript_76303:501-1202(-)